MSDVYTHGHHESVLRSHRWRTAENSAAYLLPHLKPHMRVLDVGCGPGTITAGLADRVPRGHVTGIDTAPEVLDQARELAANGTTSTSRPATSTRSTIRTPRFDVVHAHQVMQHLGDPVRALTEMRRVTKPGGLIAVRDADYGGMIWYPELPVLDDWLALYHKVARGNGGEPDAGAACTPGPRQAGLTDVTCDVDHLDVRHPAGTTVVGRPMGRPDGQVVVRGERRRTAATPPPRTWKGSPQPGALGPHTKTDGSRL